MKAKRTLFWIIVVSFFSVLQFSCGAKIQFSKEPVIVENRNKSTPLTCFVDFETVAALSNVVFKVTELERSFELEYSYPEKSENGYLLYLMRLGIEHIIEINITDHLGKTHQLENVLTFTTSQLPEADMEFPKIEVTGEIERISDDLILFNPRRRTSSIHLVSIVARTGKTAHIAAALKLPLQAIHEIRCRKDAASHAMSALSSE